MRARRAAVFATLGAYNLPANGTSRASQSTYANAADRALIQSVVDRSGNSVLTMVLKAVNDNNAHGFGDGEYYGNDPILRITTGTNEPPLVTGITAQPGSTDLPINTVLTLSARPPGRPPWLTSGSRIWRPLRTRPTLLL